MLHFNKNLNLMFKAKVFIASLIIILPSMAKAEDCVAMLHGLASSTVVFKPLELVLDLQPELRVHNQGYNSYAAPIDKLAEMVVSKAIEHCHIQEDEQIHFVTHSLGGILLRTYLLDHQITNLGRVVMVAPPNKGSEVVDLLEKYRISAILGPAGKQLNTEIDKNLNTPLKQEFELGIIAGVRERQWVFGRLIPEKDDGKVSVESTKLAEMDDFVEVESGHTGLLIEKETIEQTIHFLRYGSFFNYH